MMSMVVAFVVFPFLIFLQLQAGLCCIHLPIDPGGHGTVEAAGTAEWIVVFHPSTALHPLAVSTATG